MVILAILGLILLVKFWSTFELMVDAWFKFMLRNQEISVGLFIAGIVLSFFDLMPFGIITPLDQFWLRPLVDGIIFSAMFPFQLIAVLANIMS